MATATRHVRVGGWSNPRALISEGDVIALEIALSHNHCPTCADRVRYITQQLSDRNVQYNWRYERGRSFIEVAAPGSGLRAEEYLSGLLGLHIN